VRGAKEKKRKNDFDAIRYETPSVDKNWDLDDYFHLLI
jgi:hypothetical protein